MSLRVKPSTTVGTGGSEGRVRLGAAVSSDESEDDAARSPAGSSTSGITTAGSGSFFKSFAGIVVDTVVVVGPDCTLPDG